MKKLFLIISITIFIFTFSKIYSAEVREVRSKELMPPFYSAMDEIEKSTTLSKEEKIKRLSEYFKKENNWGAIIYRFEKVDKNAALRITLERFRDPRISKEHKLQLGRVLLQKGRFEYNQIIPDYKQFLVNEIVNNIKNFMKRKEEHSFSAVGEYSFIASGFEGYDSSLFEQFKDSRVIPNLIIALNVPDEIYSKDQGCVIMGRPGKPTGRNLARQFIPVALARLNAKSAIPALIDKYKNHHDYWLRYYSAYALGYLLDEGEQKNKFIKILKLGDVYKDYQFAFAKGLIEKGDFSGLEYIHITLEENEKDRPSSILYEIEMKLNVVKVIKNKKLAAFYTELLQFEPLRQLLVGDLEKIEIDEGELKTMSVDKTITKDIYYYQHCLPRVIKIYEDILNGILLNDLEDLGPLVNKIGKDSKNQEIKNTTNKFLKKFE